MIYIILVIPIWFDRKIKIIILEISDMELFTIQKVKIGERETTSLIDYDKQETGSSIEKQRKF